MTCSDNSPSQQTGEERKQAAHTVLDVHREACLRLARRTLLEVLIEHGTASIDDVRALVRVPKKINPKFFGAVPGPLARLNIIAAQSMVKTRRRVAHARHVTLWRLADIGKAKEWLRTHPPIEIDEDKKRRAVNDTPSPKAWQRHPNTQRKPKPTFAVRQARGTWSDWLLVEALERR